MLYNYWLRARSLTAKHFSDKEETDGSTPSVPTFWSLSSIGKSTSFTSKGLGVQIPQRPPSTNTRCL